MPDVPSTGAALSSNSNPVDDMVPLVYDELRRLAACYLRREGSGCSLQPTALVHEAYVQMAQWKEFQWRDRAQFFGAAALVMRRVLSAAGRRRHSLKRGGDAFMVPLDQALDSSDECLINATDLDLALTRLSSLNPLASQVLELRIFGGLTVEEAADYLAVSPATVKRAWIVARAWLIRELG